MSDARPPAADEPSGTAPSAGPSGTGASADPRAALLRPAGEEDAPFLGRLWAEAFPGERGADERTEALLEDRDPYGGLDEAPVARVDGEPVGAVRTYRLRVHLGGRVLPTLGVGAVAVLPRWRGRGIGRRICMEALRIGRARGDVLSLLYPFRVDFYARLGYALVGERHRYRFRLPELDGPGAEEGGRVVRLRAEEGWDEPAAVYARVARRSDGMLEREARHWRRLDRPEHVRFLLRDRGGPAGYAVVRDAGEGVARVVELVAETDGARLRLLRAPGEADEGWTVVEHDAFPAEGLDRMLGHPARADAPSPGPGRASLWFETAGRLRGPMIRVLHPGALAADGAEVGLDDPVLPENRGRWEGGTRLSEEPGPDAVGPGRAAARLTHDFRLLDEF